MTLGGGGCIEPRSPQKKTKAVTETDRPSKEEVYDVVEMDGRHHVKNLVFILGIMGNHLFPAWHKNN